MCATGSRHGGSSPAKAAKSTAPGGGRLPHLGTWAEVLLPARLAPGWAQGHQKDTPAKTEMLQEPRGTFSGVHTPKGSTAQVVLLEHLPMAFLHFLLKIHFALQSCTTCRIRVLHDHYCCSTYKHWLCTKALDAGCCLKADQEHSQCAIPSTQERRRRRSGKSESALQKGEVRTSLPRGPGAFRRQPLRSTTMTRLKRTLAIKAIILCREHPVRLLKQHGTRSRKQDRERYPCCCIPHEKRQRQGKVCHGNLEVTLWGSTRACWDVQKQN